MGAALLHEHQPRGTRARYRAVKQRPGSALPLNHELIDFARQALAALEPSALVAAALSADDRPTTILSIGKAAAAMAAGAERALDRGVKRVVCAGPDRGGHPLPTAGSLEAGRELLAAAADAGADERVVALISGGGSSLAEVPAGELTLDDLRAANRVLIRSGLAIDEINVVRKHLSRLKGGQLGRAAAPAQLSTLVLSDVISGSLASVASGPTVGDPSTFADALAIARRLQAPEAVLAHLEAGVRGEVEETPSRVHGTVHVLADNRALVAEAGAAARVAGLDVEILDRPLTGDPSRVADELSRRVHGSGVLLVGGGEVTPSVPDGAPPGGRAHQLALELAIRLEDREGAVALVIGSDGVDGDSGGAGAEVRASTAAKLRRAGIDPLAAAAEFDAASALATVGCQLPANPTGNNLGDLLLVWTGDAKLR